MKEKGTLTLNDLADDSRVWIYQSNRPLSQEEVKQINYHLDHFCRYWTSHNRSLLAFAKVFHERFIVVFLDQSASSMASGCSIDKLVHFVEGLGSKYGIDFMDRMLFLFQKDREIIDVRMDQLSEMLNDRLITPQTPVYNTLVKTKKEWQESWLIPLKESWHNRFI